MCINEFSALCFSYSKSNFNIKASDKHLFSKELKLWKVLLIHRELIRKKL